MLVPGITADIVADGAVLVYFRDTNTTGPWYSLPYEQPGVTISLLDFGVGYIDIDSNVNETGVDIRVVIIPAATVNSIVMRGIDVTSYTNVASAYHLPIR